jgi:hypothetical protein
MRAQQSKSADVNLRDFETSYQTLNLGEGVTDVTMKLLQLWLPAQTVAALGQVQYLLIHGLSRPGLLNGSW